MNLIGVGDIDRKLAAIGNAVSPPVVKAALLEGGEVIAEEARRLAPVLTGQLQASIIVTFDLGGLNLSRVSERRWLTTVYVGPERRQGFYGHMVEFGTEHSAAHPFMRPALDNTRDEVRQVIANRLWVSIKKAA